MTSREPHADPARRLPHHDVGGNNQAGPSGKVVAVDAGGEQLDIARRATAPRTNIEFVEASAYDTGLARASFDLVHCRFLLLHLTDALAALREMIALVRPGGTVICFDTDLMTIQSLSETEAYVRYVATALRTGAARGLTTA